MSPEKKKPASPKTATRKKAPVYVSELMKQESTRPRTKAAPAEPAKASAPAADAPDVYQFVSDGYQSITRTVTELRDAFKKDPVHALQDLQIRTLAFLSKKLPSRKANPDGKDDYRRMRREWIKRRVLQSKPARALKNRLTKKP